MGKTAIVTGGNRGIGQAVADRLAADGWEVHRISRAVCDLTDPAAIAAWMRKIDRVDVLVNCAGRSHLGRIEELSEPDLQAVYEVNVLGTMRMCQAVLPLMKKQRGGYIINLGSLRGIETCPGKAAYSMSKFAVRAFSNTLGLELQSHKIKVTCINPGFVYTELIKHRIAEEKLKPADILVPEDIAETVCYLLRLSKGAWMPEINLGEVWE